MTYLILYIGIVNLICWLGCAFFAWRVRLPPYHPISIYLAYHFLGFVRRPFSIAGLGYSVLWDHIGFTPSSSTLIASCIYINSALIAIVIFPIIIDRNLIRKTQIPSTRFHIGHKRNFYIAAIILAFLGLYGTYKTFAGAGAGILGHDTVFDASGGQQLVGVSGYETALAEFLPALVIILFLIFGLNKFTLAVVLAFSGLRVWAGAQRLSFIVVALGCSFIFLMRRGTIKIPVRLIIIAVCVLLVFDVVGGDRLAFRKLLTGDTTFTDIVSNYTESSRASQIGASDFMEFDVSSIIYELVPARTGYNWGSQYLRLLIWPIPRQLWPNKPVLTGLIDLNKYGNFLGLTWSTQADLFSIFGYPSLIIGMFFLGLFLYKFHKRATKTRSPYQFAAYWMLIIYTPTLYRDGGVTVFYFLVFSYIAAFLLIRFGKIQLLRGDERPHLGRRRYRTSRSRIELILERSKVQREASNS